jgi:hypothetical protein
MNPAIPTLTMQVGPSARMAPEVGVCQGCDGVNPAIPTRRRSPILTLGEIGSPD